MGASLPWKPKQQQRRAKHNGQYWAFKRASYDLYRWGGAKFKGFLSHVKDRIQFFFKTLMSTCRSRKLNKTEYYKFAFLHIDLINNYIIRFSYHRCCFCHPPRKEKSYCDVHLILFWEPWPHYSGDIWTQSIISTVTGLQSTLICQENMIAKFKK